MRELRDCWPMRLSLAFDAGLPRPDRMFAYNPAPGFEFEGLPVDVEHRDFMAAQYWGSRVVETAAPAPLGLVCVPRSKAQARDLIARASALATDWVVVDGQKTDGVESHFKALRKMGVVVGSVTKAHGRIFWFKPFELSEWSEPPRDVDGLVTRVGVFSAEKVDAGSAALAEALPDHLGPNVVDLGAGWGWLSREILKRESVETLTLIEADRVALDCARENLKDERARFIWGDATQPRARFDTVVMNPPFHQGRSGEPALGQAFIRTAAASLTPRGALWMVANRHLPYEDTLRAHFG